jgi:hypothetical protein
VPKMSSLSGPSSNSCLWKTAAALIFIVPSQVGHPTLKIESCNCLQFGVLGESLARCQWLPADAWIGVVQ